MMLNGDCVDACAEPRRRRQDRMFRATCSPNIGRSAVWSAMFSLLGVTLGAASSLLVYYLGARVWRERFVAAQLTARRGERMEALRTFLGAVQDAEALARRIHVTGVRQIRRLTHW
jgi:hypothetical protein